ncbi:unnamed protein product [Bursaphelenchus xylophilus]|uniref:(pine wood nematode) hypothetical protein n=1 Tax=Bursaphelenchus xylophilus TaxID=6326 RepID=A0A1I7S2X9_BURXY|nr:unnamed protein product [Bursaphelenchus xylophilus]CAG9116022.1 unnamed protein product [Bursaphelenchus xylophilus]
MVFGPKSSGFCAFISLWGVIFMGVLGLAFYNQAVGLLSSLPESENEFKDFDQLKKIVEDKYWENALKCWYICGFYGVTFVLSAIRLAFSV